MRFIDEVSLKTPTEISVVAGKEGSIIKVGPTHYSSYIEGDSSLPYSHCPYDVLNCCCILLVSTDQGNENLVINIMCGTVHITVSPVLHVICSSLDTYGISMEADEWDQSL